MKLCGYLLALVFLFKLPFAAAERCDNAGEALTELGQRFEHILALNRQNPQDMLRSPLPARYLRILIESGASSSSGWRLSIKDRDYRPLQTLGPADFKDGENQLWTRRLAGSLLHFDLLFSNPDANASLKVREFIAMPEQAEHPFYSTQTDTPAWRSLFSDDPPRIARPIRRRGDAVGFLMGSRIPTSWCCSGVVIATEPDILFLTNFHCGKLPALADVTAWKPETCRSTLIDLSWDEDQQSREYHCEEVILKDLIHDIAVLRIAPVEADSAPLPPILRRRAIDAQELVTIIHHPECQTKKISASCQVVDTAINGWRNAEPEIDFTHICDTEGGSSGAPVFDQDGLIVGLHHLGFEKNETGDCDKKNKATRIDKILEILDNHPQIKGLRIQ